MNELEGFVKFDFTIGVPSASITPNGVTFNRSVVSKMSNPEHVVLLINKEARQIAIQACSQDTPQSIAFYKHKEKDKAVQSVRWNNRDLLNTLSELMGWDLKETQHRVEGRLLPQGNVMIFDLNRAVDLK